MNIQEALRAEIEMQREKARAAIENQSRDDLIAYAKDYVTNHGRFEKARVLENILYGFFVAGDTATDIIQFVEEDGHAYDALKSVVTEFRKRNIFVYPEIRDFVLDMELKVRKRPRKKKSSTTPQRNILMCECINDLVQHSNLRATRNDENPEQDCAVAILADAIGLTYGQVKDIWESRDKELFGPQCG